MKKILIGIFLVSLLGYSQNISNINITGITEYLSDEEVNEIRNLIPNSIRTEDLPMLENRVKEKFKNKYGIKFVSDKGNLDININPVINSVTYGDKGGVFSTVKIPSLKVGNTMDDVDDRELALLELNPHRDTRIFFNLNREGKLDVKINENKSKLFNNKFYVGGSETRTKDKIRNEKLKDDLKYGYEYTNYNLSNQDDILKLKAETSNDRDLLFKATYIFPDFENLRQTQVSGLFARSLAETNKIKFKSDAFEGIWKNTQIVKRDFNFNYGIKYLHYLNSLKINGREQNNGDNKDVVVATPLLGFSKIYRWNNSVLELGLNGEKAIMVEPYYRVHGNADFISFLGNNILFSNNIDAIRINRRAASQLKETLKNRDTRVDEYFGMETNLEYGKDYRIGLYNRFEIGENRGGRKRVLTRSDAIGLSLYGKFTDHFNVRLNGQVDVLEKKKNYKLGFRVEGLF